MAQTKTSQRVAIIIILILMLGGTVAGYVMAIWNLKSQETNSDMVTKLNEKLKVWQEKYQAEMVRINEGLSDRYYPEMLEFKDVPKAFNSESIESVGRFDHKIGSGEVIDKDSKYRAYYIGWDSKGEIFDSSLDGAKLKDPFMVGGALGNSVIEGWSLGVEGMRIGGVREISIPAKLAYGESAADSQPKGSLKFIIKIIEPLSDEDEKKLIEISKSAQEVFKEEAN